MPFVVACYHRGRRAHCPIRGRRPLPAASLPNCLHLTPVTGLSEQPHAERFLAAELVMVDELTAAGVLPRQRQPGALLQRRQPPVRHQPGHWCRTHAARACACSALLLLLCSYRWGLYVLAGLQRNHRQADPGVSGPSCQGLSFTATVCHRCRTTLPAPNSVRPAAKKPRRYLNLQDPPFRPAVRRRQDTGPHPVDVHLLNGCGPKCLRRALTSSESGLAF